MASLCLHPSLRSLRSLRSGLGCSHRSLWSLRSLRSRVLTTPSPLKGGGRGPLRVLGDGATPPARHRPLGRTFGRDARFAPCSLMTAAPPAFGRPGWGRAHPQGRRRDGRFAPCAFAPRSPLLDGRCAPVGIVGVAPLLGSLRSPPAPPLRAFGPAWRPLWRDPGSADFVFPPFRFPSVVFIAARQIPFVAALAHPTPSRDDMQNTKPNKIVAALRRSRESQTNPPRVETVLDAAARRAQLKKDSK